MGFKRIIRDLVFIYIAFNLITAGSFNLMIYGSLIAFFTISFYLGKKI